MTEYTLKTDEENEREYFFLQLVHRLALFFVACAVLLGSRAFANVVMVALCPF